MVPAPDHQAERGIEAGALRHARPMKHEVHRRTAQGFLAIGRRDTQVGQGGATGQFASGREELGPWLADFTDGPLP